MELLQVLLKLCPAVSMKLARGRWSDVTKFTSAASGFPRGIKLIEKLINVGLGPCLLVNSELSKLQGLVTDWVRRWPPWRGSAVSLLIHAP